MTDDSGKKELDDRSGVSNIAILEPDIGLGDHLKTSRMSRVSDNSRREESSISFRRFLQNDSNRSTHPDLYSSSLQDHLSEGEAIDQESPDLPDFVQDHLAVEQLYYNDETIPSKSTLPDFASFMLQNNNEREQVFVNAEKQIPLDLPTRNFACNKKNIQSQNGVTLPFDLTTDSNENCTSGNSSCLPDFLSDGHILGPDNSCSDSIEGVLSNVNNQQISYGETKLKNDNDRLREKVHVLESALMKKDDRIKELEDIVVALEISKLQKVVDANTQTASQVIERDQKETESLAVKVKYMTNTSERLVRDLLKIITDLQNDIKKSEISENSKKNEPFFHSPNSSQHSNTIE